MLILKRVKDWRHYLVYDITQRLIDQIKFTELDRKVRKQRYAEYLKQPLRYYVADFECTTEEPYQVYLATVKEIGKDHTMVFYSIEEFIDYFSDKRECVVWFHNGENYDFEFILPYAYKHKIQIKFKKSLQLRFFQPYMEVDLRNGKLKEAKNGDYMKVSSTVHFLDSLKIVQSSIASIGEMLGLSKGMGTVETPLVHYINSDNDWMYSTGKLEDKTYQEHHMTSSFKQALIDKQWTEYAIRDTEILEALALEYDFIKHYDNSHLSIASIAFDSLLQTCPEYADFRASFAKHIASLDDKEAVKEALKKLNERAKLAYKGGIAWTNPLYADKLLFTKYGYHLDYTSMYPGIYSSCPLPYFEPSTKPTDLFIIHFEYIHATVKEGCFPLLKNRTDAKGPNSDYYLPTYEGPISLTSVEYQYLLDCYDIHEIGKYEKVYYERHTKLEKALKTHKDIWYKEKEIATGARKVYAKLMLNSCYGYLGFFNSERNKYSIDYDDEQNLITKELLEDKAITGLPYPEVPAAAFITAYGRVKLARDINAIGIDHVVCCDTDSLFIVDLDYDTITSRVTIGDEIGQFKLEHTFKQIISIKAKTYCIANEDGVPIAQATAGSNYKFKHIENFKSGQVFVSTEKVRGSGGVGIVHKHKVLGGAN